MRWAALGLAVLTAAALVVIVGHGGDAPAASAADPAVAPVPPAGRLYTQLGPPGWSQQAGWVLPITAGTVPVTDPATGVTVAITPADRSTPDTAAQRVGPRDRWLSVLEPDGRTRYAAPLEGAPRFGPVITRIDGTTVALLADTDRIRYRPLTGGPDTTVDLPAGGKLTATPAGRCCSPCPATGSGTCTTVRCTPCRCCPAPARPPPWTTARAGHPTGHRGLVDAPRRHPAHRGHPDRPARRRRRANGAGGHRHPGAADLDTPRPRPPPPAAATGR